MSWILPSSASTYAGDIDFLYYLILVITGIAFVVVEVEDLLLDRLPPDQPIDGHPVDLSDAVRAVGGLVLDGGVPPRVEQEDVIGGREVEPGASGLQRDQQHRRAVLGLEATHHAPAVPR